MHLFSLLTGKHHHYTTYPKRHWEDWTFVVEEIIFWNSLDIKSRSFLTKFYIQFQLLYWATGISISPFNWGRSRHFSKLKSNWKACFQSTWHQGSKTGYARWWRRGEYCGTRGHRGDCSTGVQHRCQVATVFFIHQKLSHKMYLYLIHFSPFLLVFFTIVSVKCIHLI